MASHAYRALLEWAPGGRRETGRLAIAQGSYFLVTGVWPLVDISSFLWVTGPKADLWLVRTVGALIAVVGAVLLSAGCHRRVSREIVLLAAGSALGLATIDIVYAVSRTISPIYLFDAALEMVWLALWAQTRKWAARRAGSLASNRHVTSAGGAMTGRLDCRFLTLRVGREPL